MFVINLFVVLCCIIVMSSYSWAVDADTGEVRIHTLYCSLYVTFENKFLIT